jgi:hypothetical protein
MAATSHKPFELRGERRELVRLIRQILTARTAGRLRSWLSVRHSLRSEAARCSWFTVYTS